MMPNKFRILTEFMLIICRDDYQERFDYLFSQKISKLLQCAPLSSTNIPAQKKVSIMCGKLLTIFSSSIHQNSFSCLLHHFVYEHAKSIWGTCEVRMFIWGTRGTCEVPLPRTPTLLRCTSWAPRAYYKSVQLSHSRDSILQHCNLHQARQPPCRCGHSVYNSQKIYKLLPAAIKAYYNWRRNILLSNELAQYP